MKKSRNCEKELSVIQQLKEQRDFYKDQYDKLRKIIDRLNLELPENPRLKNANEFLSTQEKKKELKQKLKKWQCHRCLTGMLKMITVPQGPNNLVYFRKCTNLKCTHKTRLKPYSKEVEPS